MDCRTTGGRLGAVVLGLVLLGASTMPARANDDLFPPAPAAKGVIDFDGRGFMVNGQRQFIASGSIHFPRVPRELWRDRLLQLKRAGFNTVQTYVFWNANEPRKGEFDFSGVNDLAAFLQTAQNVGLYAIVRPGPYVCAEWDSGGYPWIASTCPNAGSLTAKTPSASLTKRAAAQAMSPSNAMTHRAGR